MTLAEKQSQMIEQINSLGDCLEQFSYLTSVAGQLPPLKDELRSPEHLVSGCQSKVWLCVSFVGGHTHLKADSDTLLLKGILYLLHSLLEDCPVQEVAVTDITCFYETDLLASFSESRNRGFRSILATIRHEAENYINTLPMSAGK